MNKQLLFVFVFAFPFLSNGQDADSSMQSFSLEQAVEYALKNHSNVKNAIIDEQIAKKKVAEITGIGLPQISGSIDVKDFLDIPTQVIPAEAFGGPPGTYSEAQFGIQYQAMGGIEVSQLLFSGDYFLGLVASKVYVELSTHNVNRTKIETAVAVSKAYYTVLVNQDRMELMDANIKRVKTAMGGVQGLAHYGFAEKIDYDRLKVTYNNLLTEKQKLARLLEVGTFLLKYQMGLDVNQPISLTDQLDNYSFDVADSTENTSTAFTKRAEFNILNTQLKLDKLELKRNRLSFIPSAHLYGSFSKNGFNNKFDFLNSQQIWYPTSVIGGTIKVPIFTGTQQHAKTQQAKLNVEKAENTLRDLENAIALEIANAKTNLINATSSLEHQKKNIEIATEVVRITKIKFEQGVGTNLEIVSAEEALKESQINYYNTLYEAIIAKIDYDKAVGSITY